MCCTGPGRSLAAFHVQHSRWWDVARALAGRPAITARTHRLHLCWHSSMAWLVGALKIVGPLRVGARRPYGTSNSPSMGCAMLSSLSSCHAAFNAQPVAMEWRPGHGGRLHSVFGRLADVMRARCCIPCGLPRIRKHGALSCCMSLRKLLSVSSET